MPRKLEIFRASSLALLLAGLLLGGCRQGEERSEATPGIPAAETPRRGGTVVTGWVAEPGGVNELIVPSSQVTNELLFRIFVRLLEEQSDFEEHPPTFKPQLAKSFEWSPDHKILTFHLREDAVWSDGVPITAEDVRWTWQAQMNPDVAWDTVDSKRWITDVEVVDPHTVRMHFARVDAKQLLAANEGVILPKHAWEELPFSKWRQSGEWFKEHLVVSGPFTIASWQPGQQLVLQRNERYYDKRLPYLDRVVMRFVPDQASVLAQLLNGEVDFVPQISPDDAPRVKANPRLELIPIWFNIYVGVFWNNEHPLFSDPEVRRALTLGIDRQTIVDTVWRGGYGRIATSPIITSVWAHDKSIKPWPYDPAEARRILGTKGWKDTNADGVLDRDGKPFTFELLTNAGNQARTDAAVMIQDQLNKVGVRVEPRQVEFNTLMSQMLAGKYAAAILGQSLDTSLDMTDNFHSRSIATGGNFPRYRNPEMDRLLETAASQREMLDERPYLERIQRILHREQPITFIWESQRLNAANKRLRNVKPTAAFSFFNLEEWWIEPGG